jgi:hypothetical protein
VDGEPGDWSSGGGRVVDEIVGVDGLSARGQGLQSPTIQRGSGLPSLRIDLQRKRVRVRPSGEMGA